MSKFSRSSRGDSFRAPGKRTEMRRHSLRRSLGAHGGGRITRFGISRPGPSDPFGRRPGTHRGKRHCGSVRFSVCPLHRDGSGRVCRQAEPLYLLPEGLGGRFVASLFVSGAALATPRTLPPVQLTGRECHSFPISTADLPDGRYEISYELKDREDRTMLSQTKPVYIDRGLRARIDAASCRLQSLSGKRDSGVRYAVALETVEYLENTLRGA